MRLLYAEDENSLRELTAQRLTEAGYSVDACADGLEALDYLAVTDYDAVILDILMPRLDGLSVLRQLRREGKSVVLVVEDTGVGIPEEDLDKIFDRFYRVDKARSRAAGGTGLGLSIVRDTARQHGGEVSAQSREGAGSRFTVRFPALEEGGGEHEA